MRNRLAFCLIGKVRREKSEGSSATQQSTGFNGFNGWMLRGEVKREEARGEKEDFSHSPTLRLSPSPTLPLSQLKIKNSLTVNCSIVQSQRYDLNNFNVRRDARYFKCHHSPGFCRPHLCLFPPRPIAENQMQKTIVKA
ncbi:hypothetical protein [Microcoleus sp. B3-A4]|uniref:hypothetical protein n=1 Tax=Microcoleus sp. B3-A4 TaxID=2818653 RepID=UPI002FD788F8